MLFLMNPAAASFFLIRWIGAVSIIRGPIFLALKEPPLPTASFGQEVVWENPTCLVNFTFVPRNMAWSVWRLVIFVLSRLILRPMESQNVVIRESNIFVSSNDPVTPSSHSSA